MALEETVSRAGLARPSRLVLPACGLILTLVFCAGLLAFLNGTLGSDWAHAIVQVASAAVGGVLAAKKPTNPVGWLFLGTALFVTLQELASQWAVYGLNTEPGAPLSAGAAWVATWAGPLGAALAFVILPLYFPNGRPVSPRWRPVTRLVVLLSAADALLYSLLPDPAVNGTDVANPLGVEALRPYADALSDLGLAIFLGLILVRAEPRERGA